CIDIFCPGDGSIDDLEVFGLRLEVLGTCGELDAFVSIPDEGDMTFLRKKVKSGAAVEKLVLLQLNSYYRTGFMAKTVNDRNSVNFVFGVMVSKNLFPVDWYRIIVGVFYLVDFSFDLLLMEWKCLLVFKNVSSSRSLYLVTIVLLLNTQIVGSAASKFGGVKEAKMVLYNALPKKEYERIFMCKTAKDIWQLLLITHRGNSQVKDNKIDLLVQQYEQFTILEEESIDSSFARFNTIITSLKALDEGFSSKNYVRKILRDLHPKWRAKVTTIKESKDLSSLALDELIRNLKVHEVVMEKDSKIYRGKKERVKSIALKAKKESSDDETLTSGSDDEEYAMAVRNFKTFFRRKGNLLGNQEKKRSHSDKEMRRKERVTENVLDAVIQIISLAIVQNHLATKIKRPSLEVCLRTCLEPDEWIKDSGCSKHMTGSKSLFSTYKAYDGGINVVFGSNLKGKITGKGSEIIKDGKIIGNGIRKNGLYVMKLGNKSQDKLCLATVVDNSTLWHRRLGHANMRLIQSLSSKELVRNLPKLKCDKHFCDACKFRKQAHASHKAKNMVSTKRCLELLHMDLFGPSAIKSYGGNLYTLVVVDDYSRYTWTRFLKTKNEAFEKFEILSRKIQNQLGSSIIAIRTDHGREFDNEVQFGAYCDAQGITHNFSAPRTPQSNEVVERKNKTLQEMSRTMLNEQSVPQKFWCNVVDTSTYILNRILIRPILGKTPYEIFRGRKPSLEYFKVFGSKFFILNTKDYLTKLDLKSYKGVFLGYSQNSKAYVILNKHTMKVKESLNVTFNESPPPTKLSPLVDDDVGEEEAIRKNTKIVNINNEEDESIEVDEIVNIKESKNHPLDQVIGNINQRTLRSQAQNHSNFFCFISTIEPKNVNEALKVESWVVAMQEELNQFVANDVWELVPLPISQSVIGTKWVFKNKLDENGIVSRNKARLVAQGYNQQEGTY
ncbi:retrovirus-related pol polyprotein from transposon TNT 1-94, partial [Tanacetum coccineum]